MGTGKARAAERTVIDRMRAIARHRGLRVEFPEPVMAQARALVAAPGIDDPSLTDLTELPFVTIDYPQSQDLDQALFIERMGTGFRVDYALADAAHFVRPGTALWDEAVARGASYYLPGLTLPMLPAELSEGIVSLGAGVDRRALVFRIELAADGAVRTTELVRARIRSRAKLSYGGVQRLFDEPAASGLEGQEFTASLRLLGEVGRIRIERAEKHDVVEYDRVAVRLSCAGVDSTRLEITGEVRNDVQRWNEQISLLTNIEGAGFLLRRADPMSGLRGVFRVHPPPPADDLAGLETLIRDLVQALELDHRWIWRRSAGESLADYVDRLPDEGRGVRLARALQRQALLVNEPGRFSVEPGPHYGIGAAAYARFSSPMREMVGIATTHLALHQLDRTPSGLTREQLEEIVRLGNESKRQQKRITRDADEQAIDQLLSGELDRPERARPIRTATVMGVSERKIYLQLDEPPIEIKLYLPDQERLLGEQLTAVNRFELRGKDGLSIRVGDEARVVTHAYDRERRRWVLRLVRR
jgi:ribonuclease R